MKKLKYAAALLTAVAMSPSWSQASTLVAQSHVDGVSRARPALERPFFHPTEPT